MRMSFVLLFLLTTFSVSAAAADADQNLKQEVEKVASAYAQSFNRQDGAGIAALYASGGMFVNPAGPRTDIAQFSEEAFKAGFNHLDITVNQVWPFGTDAALAMGESRMTGKNQSGAPIEGAGLWTAVDVREGGNWKIRMLSIIPSRRSLQSSVSKRSFGIWTEYRGDRGKVKGRSPVVGTRWHRITMAVVLAAWSRQTRIAPRPPQRSTLS